MITSSGAAYTIGTAGHVDHGKSALINALTGIDPDRLREEKERGMTIDLGFAWLQLPSGREVSIIDVPGHERFVHNMLAGVGGIDAALVIIAADEGVMPQTREHVAILDLLRIDRAVIALTKCDLVDAEWRALVCEDIKEALAETVVESAPLVEVSALDGEGLTELTAKLDDLLENTPPKRDLGRPRLPVDRVFTLGGFGTVATGTLLDGMIDVGQDLEIQPGGLQTRARGLQSHKSSVARAQPGRRIAINLAGLAVADVRRGDVVTSPGSIETTQLFDAYLNLLPDSPRAVKRGTSMSLHIGTAEVIAKVRPLETPALEPGGQGWVQVSTQKPVAALKGDVFILRQLSPAMTWGGGEIVDAQPAHRHRRGRQAVLDSLDALASGRPDQILFQTLAVKGPLTSAGLVQASNLPTNLANKTLMQLQEAGHITALGELLITSERWAHRRNFLLKILREYHRQHPLRLGMPREEFRSRVRLTPQQFTASLYRLQNAGELVEEGIAVREASHSVKLTIEHELVASAFLARLDEAPLSPPKLTDLLVSVPGLTDELVDALEYYNRVVRVSEDVCFTTPAYSDMTEKILMYLKENGSITVAKARDLCGTSRRYVLAFLEHLDQDRTTRRVGDERVLLDRKPRALDDDGHDIP